MRRSPWGWRQALGVGLLGFAAVGITGCKKEQPPMAPGGAAVDARPPGPVKGVAPLRFSEVAIRRKGETVNVTYTLTNPGTAQARGSSCMAFLDDRGLPIRSVRLGGITVKGGVQDTFEDQTTLPDLLWGQTRSVWLYTVAAWCDSSGSVKTSEPLRLLPLGQPAPLDLPRPSPPSGSSASDFQVSDARVSQSGTPAASSVTFTVKNVSDHWAEGSVCLRGHGPKDMTTLDKAALGNVQLAPDRSTTLTQAIHFRDDRHWDEVTRLGVFVSPGGCTDRPGPFNKGFSFPKPDEVRAPVDVTAGEAADGGVEREPTAESDVTEEAGTE
jgi:hypothetical protein